MSALYLEALGGNAASLSVLMAGAWMARQPAGNSGWIDKIWPFSLGLTGPAEATPPSTRQWRDRDRRLRTRPLFPPPSA